MDSRRSLTLLLLIAVPALVTGSPTHGGSHHSVFHSATRSLLGGAANLAKSTALAGANFAQSATSQSANVAHGVAREVANVSTNLAHNAAAGAKNVSDVVVEKAKEGAKDAANAAKVGAKEVWVVAADPTQPIFPGTRWCGAGNKAENQSDIGVFSDVDKCCRSHDNCFDNIPAGETKHGLENEGTFTRSHCDCDEQFYNCLKKADDLIGAKVGFTYFNVLRPQCFREEKPVVRCAKSSGVAVTKRCSEYEINQRSTKMEWQWFDAKEY